MEVFTDKDLSAKMEASVLPALLYTKKKRGK